MTLLLIYGLKVAALLLIAGVFYRLVLERMSLGHFKRAYLLLALVFAHLIPWVPVRTTVVSPVSETEAFVAQSPSVMVEEWGSAPAVADSGSRIDARYLFILVYAAGLLFFGRRFVRSVREVVRQARRGNRQRYGRAWLVELPGQVMPHSFGRWIFCGTDNPPPAAILAHEYAHVTQGHTIDRLFVAVLRTVCWFNPLLIWYERAIVFNHEYLADRAVLRRGFALRDYQYGLLAALGRNRMRTRLASGANFHFTKKRLQMMLLPSTSPARTTVLWGLTLALGLTLLWSFGRTTVKPATPSAVPEANLVNTSATAPEIVMPAPSFVIQERQPRRPTADQITVWLNAAAYGVWIDGRRIEKADLAQYDPADFSFHTVRRLKHTARHDEQLEYEVNLTTNATFQRNRYVPNWQGTSCRWEPATGKEDC